MNELENMQDWWRKQDEALEQAMRRLASTEVESLNVSEADLARIDDACRTHGLPTIPACGRMA